MLLNDGLNSLYFYKRNLACSVFRCFSYRQPNNVNYAPTYVITTRMLVSSAFIHANVAIVFFI